MVAILEADLDLGEDLSPAELAAATGELLVPTLDIAPGEWRPEDVWAPDHGPAVGLLVLEGLLAREIAMAGRASTELLGGSDLLRPWDQDGDVGPVPLGISWRALTHVRLAVLDRDFLLAAARWPALLDRVVGRALRRSRWLAFQLGIKRITRVEGRVLVLLWALAERWAVVTPAGTHLRLRLTHEMLSKLVGARRPSVTTAIGALTEAGALRRTDDGYLLLGDPAEAMRRVAGPRS